MATSYANPGGTGDRTATITVTSNRSWNGVLSNLVDGAFGNNTTDSIWAGFTVTSADYLRFDFGAGNLKRIDEATYKQQNTTGHGTWRWYGSLDATTWFPLEAGHTHGGVATQAIPFTTNVGFYRYYEIRGVSGTHSSGPYCHEFEFKIEDFTLSVEFFDETQTRVSLRSFVVPDVITIDTPGPDTIAIPVYDRLVIEIWGAGASGSAMVYGTPSASDLGEDGEDTTISFFGLAATAGGGKRAEFSMSGETIIYVYTPGGEGGISSGDGTGQNGQRGEDGRRGNRTGSIFGAAGGDSPFGGNGGDRSPGTSIGWGGYVAPGEDGTVPGGAGAAAGYGGQAGPPIGADHQWNRSFGGGGAGAYRRFEFDYMDFDSPEPGEVITFDIGAGGAAPAGDDYGGTNLDGGAGAGGRIRITVGLVPPPPDPDGGQGTVTITGGTLYRVGEVLTATYNNDDPDGGETAFGWQWKKDGVAIPSGTGSQYMIAPADVGSDITVELTYTDDLGYTETIESGEVGPALPQAKPLDDLLDGLFAAYSSRLLVASYTGPLIRMRSSRSIDSGDGWQQAGTPANSGNYFRFDFGTPRVITEAKSPQNTYTTTTGNGVFQWQGSNDASSWTNIGGNFTWNPASTVTPMTELNGNSTAYRYYQILGVSGNLPNNLIWEFEFKIDDNGETSRIGAPGGYSYQNPGGEGNRSSMITVTTSYADGNTEAQRLVNGRYPDAGMSFWPDYNTGELDFAEIETWRDYVMPLFSGSTFYAVYDQSGNDRHLDGLNTTGQLCRGWDNTGAFFTVPNGRWAFNSHANQTMRRDAMDKPEDCIYFLEVIQRDTDRPIRDFNWNYANVMAFEHPTSTAQDWTEDQAVFYGNGRTSGAAPRAITDATYATDDTDAVVWEGTLSADRVGIRRNGSPQALDVASTGYTNEAGTQVFTWPFLEAENNRSIMLGELVFWDRDVAYESGEELAFYRLDVMLNWLDEMPDPQLQAVFEDESELDVTFTLPLEPFEGEVTFNDEAFMQAILDGSSPFGASFSDEAVMTVTLILPDPIPLPIQVIVINTGGGF